MISTSEQVSWVETTHRMAQLCQARISQKAMELHKPLHVEALRQALSYAAADKPLQRQHQQALFNTLTEAATDSDDNFTIGIVPVNEGDKTYLLLVCPAHRTADLSRLLDDNLPYVNYDLTQHNIPTIPLGVRR